MESAIVMWITLAIFNISIIALIRFALRRIQLKDTLREKDPESNHAAAQLIATGARAYAERAQAYAAAVQAAAAAAAAAPNAPVPIPAAPAPPNPDPVTDDNTSFSRTVGMIGSVILACFFWAMGNVVVYKCFSAFAEVKDILTNVGSFILAGAALYAPYAFNQLKEAFQR